MGEDGKDVVCVTDEIFGMAMEHLKMQLVDAIRTIGTSKADEFIPDDKLLAFEAGVEAARTDLMQKMHILFRPLIDAEDFGEA